MTYQSVSRGLLAALVVMGLACAPTGPESQDSDLSDVRDDGVATFDKNQIISDGAMLDVNALSAADVDAFLKKPYPDIDNQPSCLAGMTFGGKTAGALIVQTAKAYGLNPLFLLTHLQKESSLIGDTSATCSAATLQQAFGCGCPDGSSCDPQYAGFAAQLDCAGSLTKSYLNDLASSGATISGWRVGKAKTTSDGVAVTPANKATAVLYTYTPWVGDHDSGGNKAPFGNYLFWKNWTRYAKTLGYTGPGSTPSTPAGTVCNADADCNHGARGVAIICSNTGATAGQCIDGCHADSDCPSGGTCDKTLAHWACTNAPPALGKACSSDAACDGATSASGRVCGASSHVCVVGCHYDSDCPSGSSCDKSSSAWVCKPKKVPLGGSCSTDTDCNGGQTGAGAVCSTSSKTCIAGCHYDSDCSGGKTCDHTTTPWSCAAPKPKNPIGTAITGSYDPQAAIAYADAHWDDGKGECDEFVSDSAISSGHLGIPYSTWVPTTYGYLTDAGVPYDEYTPSHTAVRACPGDIVIDSNDAGSGFCVEPGGEKNCGHIGIVVQGGTSVDTILADFHNNAHYHYPIGNILGTTALGPYVSAYSTLRIYHLVNCQYY
jgi:hypothetical protein